MAADLRMAWDLWMAAGSGQASVLWLLRSENQLGVGIGPRLGTAKGSELVSVWVVRSVSGVR